MRGTQSARFICSTARLWTPRSRRRSVTSGVSRLKKDQIAERGARMARRDDREYREYLSEEQRRQPGCPAGEVVLVQPRHATKTMPPIISITGRGLPLRGD